MTVKRVMGTETEYAVSLNTPDRYNPVQLSFDVVNGAADSHSKSIRWDYRQEDPVNDARGTRLERAAARSGGDSSTTPGLTTIRSAARNEGSRWPPVSTAMPRSLIPIAVAANHIIQNHIPMRCRFPASALFSALIFAITASCKGRRPALAPE